MRNDSVNAIKQLESTARLLEPDFAQREALLEQVIAYSQAYLEGISSSPVNYPFADGRGLYDSPIAEEGIEIGEALGLLKERVSHPNSSKSSPSSTTVT